MKHINNFVSESAAAEQGQHFHQLVCEILMTTKLEKVRHP